MNAAMTFQELFKGHNLTDAEWNELVWYLATLRMRATLKALLK